MYKTKVAAFLASLVVTLVLPLSTQAATYQVTKEADTADGSCDVDCSLREAVIAANGGGEDIIMIPEGTYQLTLVGDDNSASLGDLDFTDSDQTLVFGEGAGIDDTTGTLIDAEDNDRVVQVRPGARLWMNDLTVLDGNLDNQNESGAGILNEGYLTLSSVWVYGNTLSTALSSDAYGAGIFCNGASLFIENSLIDGNLGTSLSGNVYGGGIAIASTCDATVNISTISNNAAYSGGGLYVLTDANTVSLNDLSATDNAADWTGGGLHVEGADVANPVNISRALFQGNDADSAGGGVFATAPLNIVNASFYGNHAGDAGGAFGTDSATSPEINLAFVTMTRNTADSAGPGLYVGGATPDTHIKNSIIASNNHTGDTESQEDCSGVPISDDYNYIAATLSCDVVPAAHDITNTEAGSVYFTATPVDDGGNVFVTALWETGVTLDMIPSESCTDGNGDPVTDDASGRSRPQNARCDLGAHEKADTITLTPTLTSPTSSSSQKVLNLQYTLPESPSATTVTITNGSSVTRVLTMSGSSSVNTNVNLASLASTTNVTGVAGGASLPDGTYTVTLSYQDATGNTAATASATNVLIDTVTQSPTLTSPASSSTASSINLQYTLPETPTTGTVSVAFTGSATRTLTMSNSTSVNTTVNLTSLSSTSGVTSVAGGAGLPDGTYTVTLSYQDALGNTAATAVASGVVIDTTTQTPTLTSPTTSTANTVNLQYTLPEVPLTGTVNVLFTNTSTAGVTTFNMLDNQSVNITFDPTDSGNQVNLNNIATINTITPSPMPVLADGTYTVMLRYQDNLGNSVSSVTASGVTIDTTTQSPTLTSPAADGLANTMQLTYSLPESATSGTVQVLFNDGTTTTTLVMNNTQSVNVSVDLANVANTSQVFSAPTTAISDGVYTVTVRYQDALGNTASETAVTGVRLDRVAPTLTLVGEASVTITQGDTYTDAGAQASDVVSGDLTSSIQVTNPVNTNVLGSYTVSYQVSDVAGNAATAATRTVTVIAAVVEEEADEEEVVEPIVSVTTNGKIVTVLVDGEVADTMTIGTDTVRSNNRKIKTVEFYDHYTTVLVLVKHGSSAQLTVLRLTADYQLKKKVQRSFTIDTTDRLALKSKPAKQIINTMGQRYKLKASGKLKAL